MPHGPYVPTARVSMSTYADIQCGIISVLQYTVYGYLLVSASVVSKRYYG